MTEKEMIEEMAKDVCKNINTKMCADGTCSKTWECPYSNTMAKILIKKGYRKIPEGSVIYTKEDQEDMKISIRHEIYCECNKARKETAKEILSLAIKHDNGYETDMTRFIGDLKKQFRLGVEECQ